MKLDSILSLTREKDACGPDKVSRRRFFRLPAPGQARLALAPSFPDQEKVDEQTPNPPAAQVIAAFALSSIISSVVPGPYAVPILATGRVRVTPPAPSLGGPDPAMARARLE